MSGSLPIDRTNTILYCEAFAETVEFYRAVFRFEATFENEWFTEFAIGDGSHLGIADAEHATISPVGGAGITLSWRVTDLDVAHDLLARRGARPDPIHRRWGSPAFHVRDPEGHRIELWTHG